MRTSWAALELGMELRSDEPGMVCQFDNLNQAVGSRATTNDYAIDFHTPAILVVELVAMAMALKNYRFAIGFTCFGNGCQASNPISQSHGAAFIGNPTLYGH